MSIEYIKKMFVGEILIVDDQVNEEYTDAKIMADYLKGEGFAVITKDTFPREKDLAGHKLSMLICDWMFMGDNAGNARAVISFLNNIQGKQFLPVFICTSLEKTSIEKYFLDSSYGYTMYKENNASCVFIVKKDEIKGEKLFDFLETWLKNNPSVKLLKEWDCSLESAKNKMFNDLYKASEYWPCVLAKAYKDDGEKNIGESMGEFVTKNLLSRMSDYHIQEVITDHDAEVCVEDVLDGERCYYYDDTKVTGESSFRTGDILKKGNEFWVIIKRQCDLMRNNKNLYVLKMKELKGVKNNPVFVDGEENSIHIMGEKYYLSDMDKDIINKKLGDVYSKTRVLHMGKILETASQVIISCVCRKKVVLIDLKELHIIELEENMNQYERVARLLEPYISIVTNKFAAYMSSKGSMRVPEELFTGKFFVETEEMEIK